MTRRFMMTPFAMVCLLAMGLMAQAQQPVYRGTYQSVRQVVIRLENRANLFRNGIDNWSRTASPSSATSENITVTARDFNDSVRRLRDSFDRRQATTGEVQDILTRASNVDDFVRRNSVDARTQNLWNSVRPDLNRLATAFNLTWQSTAYNPTYNSPANQYGVQTLTGTYRVDSSGSDNVRTAAERAARNVPVSQRTRVLDMVSRRLDPPEEMTFEVRGRSVTMASTRAAQVTFDADGRERVETGRNGRTIRSRSTLSGNQLTVTSTGDRGNEFTAIFQPLDNGHRLRVTRKIYTPELNQTVQVVSVYQRTSDVARFDVYNPNANQFPASASGSFIVADGTRVVATLLTPLSTRTAASGQRFTLRVTEPAEFRYATIEGHVADVDRSGRISGRSIMTLDFDTISLRDGRSYQFSGLLDQVNPRNGESVRVDTEGTIRDQNQTTRTGERAAIGTAIGAIIGAIAGGGKGAAIGAVVGAGTGAGSIYVEGRNDLNLDRGAELVIRAGAPFGGPR